MNWHAIATNSIVRAAVSGLGAAVVVDVRVFLSYKKFDEFALFDWRTAVMRWVQGAIGGALAGAGMDALT